MSSPLVALRSDVAGETRCLATGSPHGLPGGAGPKAASPAGRYRRHAASRSHEAKTYRWPYATVALIGINVLAFVFELSVGVRFVPFLQEWGLVPARVNAEVTVHNVLTLGTAMFLHVGWIHLIGNMWFLFVFGDAVEDAFGWRWFLAIYLLSGFFANIAFMVGTSGSSTARRRRQRRDRRRHGRQPRALADGAPEDPGRSLCSSWILYISYDALSLSACRRSCSAGRSSSSSRCSPRSCGMRSVASGGPGRASSTPLFVVVSAARLGRARPLLLDQPVERRAVGGEPGLRRRRGLVGAHRRLCRRRASLPSCSPSNRSCSKARRSRLAVQASIRQLEGDDGTAAGLPPLPRPVHLRRLGQRHGVPGLRASR